MFYLQESYIYASFDRVTTPFASFTSLCKMVLGVGSRVGDRHMTKLCLTHFSGLRASPAAGGLPVKGRG